MTVLSNIITPSNVLTTTNTATVTNKTLTSPTVAGMTVSDGTANGVTYLNGSKVLTSGSALTFDGTNLGVGGSPANVINAKSATQYKGVQVNNATNTIAELIGFNASNEAGGLKLYNAGSPIVQILSDGTSFLNGGNVGIGTSSPSASHKLDVTGLVRSNASANGGGQYTIAKSGTTVGVLCGSGNVIGSAATDLALYAETGNAVAFFTNGSATARATIDTSGNFLLGVTTSTGLTGTGDLAMPNNRAIRFRNAANSAYLNMIYVDGSNNLNFGFGGVPPNITFGINGIGEVSRFDSSGNLLVGTTTASGKLFSSTSSASQPALRAASTSATYADNVFAIDVDRNTTNNTFYAISYYNNGAAAHKFRVADSGNVTNTNNSYGAISDVKLKENIVDASPKLADLMQVKVRSYNMIGDTTKQLGVIAQELETVFPAMVDESPDKDGLGNDLGTTTKQVKYSVFVPMLIKALQEQQAIIESLKARLDAANL